MGYAARLAEGRGNDGEWAMLLAWRRGLVWSEAVMFENGGRLGGE